MHIKEKKAVRKVILSLAHRKKTQWDQTYDPKKNREPYYKPMTNDRNSY